MYTDLPRPDKSSWIVCMTRAVRFHVSVLVQQIPTSQALLNAISCAGSEKIPVAPLVRTLLNSRISDSGKWSAMLPANAHQTAYRSSNADPMQQTTSWYTSGYLISISCNSTDVMEIAGIPLIRDRKPCCQAPLF